MALSAAPLAPSVGPSLHFVHKYVSEAEICLVATTSAQSFQQSRRDWGPVLLRLPLLAFNSVRSLTVTILTAQCHHDTESHRRWLLDLRQAGAVTGCVLPVFSRCACIAKQ